MLTKAAFVVFRQAGGAKELLLVLTKGSPYYLFPGGTVETGEAPGATLQRELQEELGVRATGTQALGVVKGYTVGGTPVTVHIYTGQFVGEPTPLAELTTIRWMSKGDIQAYRSQIPPISLQHILPHLESQGLW